uniref:Myb-like domain-containing protein n=1 Tax=Rhizophora mucronata TaxID=61149 RepID=A0A2P2L4W3_RHIMU
MDYIDQLSPDIAYKSSQSSDGQGKDSYLTCQGVEKLAAGSVIEVSDVESGASNSYSHSLWMNNETLEADNLSIFPEYFENSQHLRAFLQSGEFFSPLDCPFQKPIPVGPEHQALIPEWNSQGWKTSSKQLDNSDSEVAVAVAVEKFSDPGSTTDADCEERLMGTCVLPMPQLEASASSDCRGTEYECNCLDGGSIRCVVQHIMEARQKLRDNLGEETFEGLGFCDMGEEVAHKFSEEEEQAFYEVVLSHPASMAKNFWEHLSAAFPCRGKKELVSYYFNVFVLRKRAQQNRFDPRNVDSDDDEWQGGDAGMAEEDEDSVVESLTMQDAPFYSQQYQAEECNEYIEDEDDTVAYKESANKVGFSVSADEEFEGHVYNVLGAQVAISSGDYSGNGGLEHLSELPSSGGDDCDVRDDSCTSFECHQDNIDCFPPF